MMIAEGDVRVAAHGCHDLHLMWQGKSRELIVGQERGKACQFRRSPVAEPGGRLDGA